MTIQCTCTTIRKANRAIFRFFEETMADSPLTVTHFAILRALQRNGPTPLSQLADELVMERTSLYRTIKPLEERKAVKIKPAARGKSKLANVTASGERLIEAAEPAWSEAQATMISLIGKEQWMTMQTALLKIPELLASQ